MHPASVKTFKVEGYEVKLPKIQDRKDPFLCPPFYFVQPSWVRDEDATFCLKCQQKFTQIRRKHHCRNCGNIFCSRCCSIKVSLPQFQLYEPQKICLDCNGIAEQVALCYSEKEYDRQEALIKLSGNIDTTNKVIKMVESGGIQLLASFLEQEDIALKGTSAMVLHSLSQHLALHPVFIEVGIIKVISNILTTCFESEQVLSDILGILSLLCSNSEAKSLVLKNDILEPLLSLLNKHGLLALLAGKVVQRLLDNPGAFELILQKGRTLIPRILAALKSTDCKIQNVLIRILVHLSSGNEVNRNWIVQEDHSSGNPLLHLLLASTNFENAQSVTDIVCLIANLASSSSNQNILQPYVTVLCKLLDEVPESHADLIFHIGRGLANFAEFPGNSLLLLQWLPSIISSLLKSEIELHYLHASRLIVSLISTEPTSTLSTLNGEGMLPFLETIFSLPGISDLLINVILRKSSRLSLGYPLKE